MTQPPISPNGGSKGGLSYLPVYLLLVLLATHPSDIPLQASPNQRPTQSQPIALTDPQTQPEGANALYLLLMAEMAINRNLKPLALKNYLIVANESNDPAIAEEATLLAIHLDATQDALSAAKRWAKIDPKNCQAQLLAMTLLIGTSMDEAIPYLKNAFASNFPNIDQEILEIQLRLTKESARALQRALAYIAETDPQNTIILLSAAQSAAQQKDPKNAKRFVNEALKIDSKMTRAIQLKSRIIHYEKSADLALEFLKTEVQKNPSNTELSLFYANALYENEEKKAAANILLPLVNDKIIGGSASMLLAEIYANEKEWIAAKKMLDKALLLPDTQAAAKYLLGEIAEYQKDLPTAIQWYSRVPESPYHIPAILRAVSLLKQTRAFDEAIELLQNGSPTSTEEQKYLLLTEIDLLNLSKKHDEAFQLVNDIIPKLPTDPDVLFSHAITAIKLKKWEIAENDLKQILKQNPNHTSASNILGCVLALKTDPENETLQNALKQLNIPVLSD